MYGEQRKISNSQNFLKDSRFVADLIDKTDIKTGDLVVEIGPGKGIITNELVRVASKVIGVEYDPNLAKNLKSRFLNIPKVEIVEANFLEWQLPLKPYKIFSNIPFNMTADIINKLLFSENPPTTAYLIMQDKAAERFIGKPIGSNTQISIFLQAFFEMKIITNIDRRNFAPVPDINAVLVEFQRRKLSLVDFGSIDLYRDFVVYGFNQWKPTILEAFSKVFSDKQLEIMKNSYKLDKLKPSELTIEQWTRMFDSFNKYVFQDKKNIVKGSERELRLKQKVMQKQHRMRQR